MRKRLTGLVVTTAMLATTGNVFGQVAGKIDPTDLKGRTLWYAQPARQWTEALPIGKGRLGAMIFGKASDERIQLNEDTLWDGYTRDTTNPEAPAVLPEVRRLLFEGKNAEATKLAGEKMMGRPQGVKSYQSLGDLHLQFADVGNVTSYHRNLDLDTGIATTSHCADGVCFTRESFASKPDNVIVIRSKLGHRCHVRTAVTVRVALAELLTPKDRNLKESGGIVKAAGLGDGSPSASACSRLCSVVT